MADFPALPLWTDAYLADTMHMSVTESGAYLHLLMAAWRSPECRLPDDEKMLGRMARCTPREWAKVRDVVMNFWTRDEKTKTWSQKRLLKEREYVRVTSAKAKHAADTKWRKINETHDADASPEHMPDTMPEPMPNLCETDAPIPIPIIEDADNAREPENPSQEAAAFARAVTLTSDMAPSAPALISIFDECRAAAFGENQRRPWPTATDDTTARRWLELGVTPELLRPMLLAKMRNRAAKGGTPPGSLNYFDQSVADLMAEAKRPMPEGKPDDPFAIPDFLDRRRQPTKTERAKAAVLRAAVAGGYAPEQPGGPAGTGDDNLSVFPVVEALRQGT